MKNKNIHMEALPYEQLESIHGGWFCIIDGKTPTGRIKLNQEERKYLKDLGYIFDNKKEYVTTFISPKRRVITAIKLAVKCPDFNEVFAGVICIN